MGLYLLNYTFSNLLNDMFRYFLSIPTTAILVCCISFFLNLFLKCVVGSEEGIRPPAEPELQAL